ncbi:hypothetical protein GPALN_006935 [Globodera pallida]|nr:hypothetical protein GPALN_006935 [Globodera pallida]
MDNQQESNYDKSPWVVACMEGNLDVVKHFVDNGQDMEVTNRDGVPGLMVACINGHANVVRFLLSKGARAGRTLANGVSPLHCAAKIGHLEVCKLLVAKGADINQKGANSSPWLTACLEGHLDIIKLFVDNGQDIEITENDGFTGLVIASSEGNANVVRFLLSKGALVDRTSDKKGYSPLSVAAKSGHLEVCKLLVAKGADTHQKGANISPWLIACAAGHLEIVKLFVDNGQDIETTTGNGGTGLMVASNFGKAKVVRFLLSKGALSHRTDANGKKARDRAVAMGHEEIVELLTRHASASAAN